MTILAYYTGEKTISNFKGDEVSATVLENGDTVQVSFKGTYQGTSLSENHIVQTTPVDGKPNSQQWSVPKAATLTVTAKASPAEPARGSIIRFPDGAVFARTHFVGEFWHRLDKPAGPWDWSGSTPGWWNWGQVCGKFGNKFALVDTSLAVDLSDVQPIAAYESGEVGGCDGGTLTVLRTDVAKHLKFSTNGRPCVRASDLRELAKRILKTVGV
jgi:hypothetical protein